jgi:hypothetical protein
LDDFLWRYGHPSFSETADDCYKNLRIKLISLSKSGLRSILWWISKVYFAGVFSLTFVVALDAARFFRNYWLRSASS